MDTWYLGIAKPSWLGDARMAGVAVFPSRTTLAARRTLPRSVTRYAVDSGGFTELQRHGRWTITPAQYVDVLWRCWELVGPFDFAAPMDWMCEPAVIRGGTFGRQHFVGTGLSVREHQHRTVDNYLQLHALAPDLPIIPVLQGWHVREYVEHVDMYAAAGINLTRQPLVGLGSVCRRQSTVEATHIITAVRAAGVRRLHGFGFKVIGLRRNWHTLTTADSMAWSLDGRFAGRCQHPPHTLGRQPKSEANCLPYALAWRHRHIHPPTHWQTDLFDTQDAA